MPNSNNTFNKEFSRTAKSINILSDSDLFDRYFVTSKQSNWSKDFNEVINTRSEDLKFVYTHTVSMQGDLLNTLMTLFSIKIEPYIPNGYKLNAKQIFDDLESIFRENPNEVRKSILAERYTDFVKGAINYVLNNCQKGLDNKLSNTID